MKDIKYLLSELHCANCAGKIEAKVRRLPVVSEANLNFVTKELKVKVKEDENTSVLYDLIKEIVQATEDGVTVCELTEQKKQTITFIIEGLDCANCAMKIEKVLNNTDSIEKAKLDFVNKKLKLSYSKQLSDKEIKVKVQKIIDKIEDGVTIHEYREHEHHQEEHLGSELLRLTVGTLLFISIIFLKKDDIIYLPTYIISYLLIGGEIVLRAIKNIFRGQIFDENFLMTVATLGAFGIGEYPEAVAVMLFYQVGEFFQAMAVNRSRRSIKNLLSIRPDVANVKKGEETVLLAVEDVLVNDLIVVKPGERIPLDGIVVKGESALDTKALTGESVPLNVKVGEQVLSGCININGLLIVRVTKIATESTIAKVLELVENAASQKAPTENFITKFARVYTPIVTISALLLAFIPPLLFEGAEFSVWLSRALVFLVISCPCALVISIPLGFFGGIGAASRNGVLVKGGNYLEALNEIEIAVFDKTGTLTEGSFKVTQINPIGISKEELLELAALVESSSNHPIAVSVLKEYDQPVDKTKITYVRELSGLGMKAIVNKDEVIVGNARLMEREKIEYIPSNELGSILYVALNQKYIGYIVVSDKVKKDAKEAIKSLKSLGIKKTVMLTGDKLAVGLNVGKELGIDEIHAELLPEDKLHIVEKLFQQKSKNGKLIFVGDGINDTPVLARADIGIAMGGLGADAAIDVADVVIMTDEPSKIVTAVKVAKRTRKIVWQNIYFALGVKMFFLALGAFGETGMWEAVFADVGVSVLAILNAMRVLKTKL